MIIIEPYGGLANRMRVIASAMAINKQKQQIKLIWNVNADLNCKFTDIFNPILNIEITDDSAKYKYIKATNQEKIYKRILATLINKWYGIDYCIKEQDFDKYIWNKKINLSEIIAKNKNTYFYTCEELNFETNINFFDYFIPTQEIQDIIQQTTAHFNQNTIGIHIRRSDNSKSIQYSPTKLFIERLTNEVNKNNNVNFFLATDDHETETEMKQKFGHKIITYQKELNRNSKKGIIDAVVDLFCLSKTRYIYGSYWSSFSDIAARLGKIQNITIKNDI